MQTQAFSISYTLALTPHTSPNMLNDSRSYTAASVIRVTEISLTTCALKGFFNVIKAICALHLPLCLFHFYPYCAYRIQESTLD